MFSRDTQARPTSIPQHGCVQHSTGHWRSERAAKPMPGGHRVLGARRPAPAPVTARACAVLAWVVPCMTVEVAVTSTGEHGHAA